VLLLLLLLLLLSARAIRVWLCCMPVWVLGVWVCGIWYNIWLCAGSPGCGVDVEV
jgi:hypothetical protein